MEAFGTLPGVVQKFAPIQQAEPTKKATTPSPNTGKMTASRTCCQY
jgi:hypothetical protein